MARNVILPGPVLKDLSKLPREIRLKFLSQLEMLLKNPAHPSLRNEKLEGAGSWAFSINMEYRATYIFIGDNIAITAVGSHKDVLGN
ncbi:MAG: type II toxin-antitoxin system RelE/ParE family toxin [Nitrospiraceae bacterium]|nr:type II toxin-antitoxin system RelE/ParE family toxin [Nitrospiraceae bacterium]